MAGMGGAVNHQPRVNGSMIPDFLGTRVMFIGEVTDQSDPSSVKVRASDGNEVTVGIDDATAKPDKLERFIEVVANVESPTAVRALVAVNLSDNFNMDNYNEAVLLAQKFPGAFTN